MNMAKKRLDNLEELKVLFLNKPADFQSTLQDIAIYIKELGYNDEHAGRILLSIIKYVVLGKTDNWSKVADRVVKLYLAEKSKR